MSAIWVRSSNEMTDWLTNVVCVLFLELFIDKIKKKEECKKFFALFYGNTTTFKVVQYVSSNEMTDCTKFQTVEYAKNLFITHSKLAYIGEVSNPSSMHTSASDRFYWIFSRVEQLLFRGKGKRILEFIVYAWVAVFDLPMSQNRDKK